MVFKFYFQNKNMASDRARAVIGFAKLLVSLALGYAVYTIWIETRGGIDPEYEIFGTSYPVIPYLAGLVVTLVSFFLLTKLSKGSGD
jgi:hypothetical protein